jgi:hypothetical protein
MVSVNPKRTTKAGWWWRARWHWDHFWRYYDTQDREKRKRFAHLTGLHGCYVNGRYLPDDEIIAIQARKIKGLDLQLNQQRRGYLRKIAKLQAQIAALQPSDDLDAVKGRGE